MKIGAIPENLLERIALMAGVVPTPFVDSFCYVLARTIMAATKLGVFEALRAGPRTAAVVAAECGTHPHATGKLLDTLVSSGYLQLEGEQYTLAPIARKWLLKDTPQSMHDIVMLRYVDWEWLTHLEEFVVTGTPLDIHRELPPEHWSLYQRGMRSLASATVGEMTRRTPVPKGARHMLDIGGSHGYYSVALCRKHPGLRSVILDLPEAVEHAAPILAQEGMGDRVVHRAGNALTDDLGSEAYDLVLMAQLVHHFDEATNRELVRRIARALRPGGYLVIQDAIRRQSPTEGGQAAALLDLYFALTSESGTWSFAEMASWQRDAGLIPRKPIRFRLVPGIGEQVAVKPGH
jgi:SAM-dependent methyltransferase